MTRTEADYKIREYMDKDRDSVERICAGPSSGGFGDNPLVKEALLTVFSHYYIEKEPDNCFIVADSEDNAAGYVLCAEDFRRWETVFVRDYIESSDNPVTKMMGAGTIEDLRKYADEYPAHLHIDLDESCQRKGLGTQLMDRLISHLRDKNVRGLCLCVAPDNEKGVHFYHKYGFYELESGEQEIVMGLRL